MGTVTTTSITNCLSPHGNPAIVYSTFDGFLYALVVTATDTLQVYRSINSGSTWASFGSSFSHTGLQEWSRIVADHGGYLNIAYRIGTGSADTIHFRRFYIATTTWSSALQTSATDANGGSIGSRWQGVDLLVHRNSDTSRRIIVFGAYTDPAGSKYGVYAMGVSISTSAVMSVNHALISGTRYWYQTGTAPGRSGVACEVEHNGDGYTHSDPNVWVSWGRTKLMMTHFHWVSSSAGWSGASGYVTIKSTMAATDYASSRWDGTRFLMAIQSPDDTTAVRVYQRNEAHTTTTALADTPAHTTGVVKYIALAYFSGTKDVRVFAVGTSTNVLYYIDYVRATGLWGAWATVSASAILNSGLEWGVRHGGNTTTASIDVIYGVSGAPNTITSLAMGATSPPSIATMITSGKPYQNGGPANVGAALDLSWTFVDTDPGQVQGSYALRRQIGAGAFQYYTAAGGTWGGSVVQNSSATPAVTLASGWALDADANYQFAVRVWDSLGVPAADYSATLTLVPSAVVNPAITAPAAAAVLTTDNVTLTWTAAQQTGARIVLDQTSPVAQTVYDSGAMMGFTDLSYTIPYTLDNATAWTATLYTYNNEGLISTGQTRSFTVAYVPPPTIYPTLLAVPASGWITVTPTSLAVVGAQPSITAVSLHRRRRTATALNTNGDFNGNTTGYAGNGATVTYSTTQFHSSPGSARCVPTGSVVARVATTSANAPTRTDLPNGVYTASGWIRPDTANKPINIALLYYDAGGTELGVSVFAVTAVIATAWHYVEVTGSAAAFPTATKVGGWIGLASTPAAGDAFYADDLVVRQANTDEGVRLVNDGDPTAAYNDWGAAANTDYEYRWTGVGSNGTTNPGPWLG